MSDVLNNEPGAAFPIPDGASANPKLQALLSDSSLGSSVKMTIVAKFNDLFEAAEAWRVRAAGLVVTNAGQTDVMEVARTGRLFLREKRIAIEKHRKELKAEALRYGKDVDSIASALTELIAPTEKYLGDQEHWVEIQAKAEADRIAQEMREKAEADRLVKEKADAEERERLRLENERLREEAAAREKAAGEESLAAAEKQAKKDAELAEEREKAEARAAAAEWAAGAAARDAKAKADAEVARLKAENDAKLEAAETKRREEIAAMAAAQRVKDAAQRVKDAAAAKERAEAEAKRQAEWRQQAERTRLVREQAEKDRLAAEEKDDAASLATCPNCHHTFRHRRREGL